MRTAVAKAIAIGAFVVLLFLMFVAGHLPAGPLKTYALFGIAALLVAAVVVLLIYVRGSKKLSDPSRVLDERQSAMVWKIDWVFDIAVFAVLMLIVFAILEPLNIDREWQVGLAAIVSFPVSYLLSKWLRWNTTA
jgi:hypothetical protein